MEEHAYILDYLPRGRPDDPRRNDPVAYGVGEKNFVALELVPKPGVNLLVGDRVALLKEDPTSPIEFVRGRIRYEEMTHAAQSELSFVLEQMVKAQADRFLNFFNNAGPITLRMHQLELLPGLGKKLMMAILDEKKKGPFKSFKEMDERVKALHQPEKLIVNRILNEIQNPGEKYHLFVLPPAPEFDDRRGPPRRH